MNIAIDVSPLQTGHKTRGVGFYLKNLKEAFLEHFPEHNYTFFTDSIDSLTSNIDIVHYPYFDPFQLTLPWRKEYKTVVTVHDLTPIIFPSHFPAGIRGKINWKVQKFRLKHVDGIITDSLASKKDIVTVLQLPESKVAVAYLAAAGSFRVVEHIDQKKQEMQKKYELPEKYILYVGDVTWNKNLPRLIQAVKKINIPLVLVGKALAQKEFDKTNPWNSDLVEVQRLVENDPHIKILGFVDNDDLVALYNSAEVFVWPSVYEGFGLPVVEAMQSGCPVIVSKESCMPEVAGDAGYYFDGYDTNSLSHAIETVYHSKELQHTLSKKGLEQSQKFSWKQTAADTIKLYKQVLS